MLRARSELSCCVPCLSPPTRNASPSTSSRLARIEPMSAAWTTADQSRLEGEQGDEQLGQVAQRRLQHAGRARAEPVAELLDRPPDERRQQGHRDGRADERQHRSPTGEARHGGGQHGIPPAARMT